MKIAYCDCFSGVSGDMLLGALLDVGVDADGVFEIVKSVTGYNQFSYSLSREKRGSIWGTRVYIVDKAQRGYKNFASIRDQLTNSSIPNPVKEKSLKVFRRLAEAEARIHNVRVEDVHFHELGAIDTIVDIVGVVAAFYILKIEKIHCSSLPMGMGTILCHHGEMPNPPPAVLEILRGVPVYGVDKPRELVTPTGAALVAELCESFGVFPPMVIKKIGYGVGASSDENPPNLLRLVIGKSADGYIRDNLLVMETNIDDMSPEVFSHLYDALFASGALDVWVVPCFMKKNRPGWILSVLCAPECKNELLSRLFSETTTGGVRYYTVDRVALERFLLNIDTPWGHVNVKVFKTPNNERFSPEYEDCIKIAKKEGISFREIYDYAYNRAKEKLLLLSKSKLSEDRKNK